LHANQYQIFAKNLQAHTKRTSTLRRPAYADVIAIMSERQRKRAQNEFDDLRRMLMKLMENSG